MKNQVYFIVVVKCCRYKLYGGGVYGFWKIVYVDFMMVMMVFFLVMWLIFIFSFKELIQIVEYFCMLLVIVVMGGNWIVNSESLISGGGDDYI